MASLNTRIRGLQIQLADAKLFVGNSDGDAGEVTMSGDATLTNAGVLTIGNDKVDNDKLANIAQGSIKVGGASNAPTDLNAKTDGYILIGDGTDVNSVAVSGDIGIDNTGAVTIQANAVEDSMVNDNVATGLAGDGLSASSGVMALDLNELTGAVVDVSADSIAIVDANDANASRKESIADLVSAMAGSGLTATNGVLSVDAITNNIIESDIALEDESANCNGANTTFTLSSTPITNSVQVFLNGLLQQEGSGKDYTLTGTTVEFTTAPLTNDILLIHYIINN